MVLHFLDQNPAALQQLKAEHHKIRKDKKEDELLTWEDFRKMDFTQHTMTLMYHIRPNASVYLEISSLTKPIYCQIFENRYYITEEGKPGFDRRRSGTNYRRAMSVGTMWLEDWEFGFWKGRLHGRGEVGKHWH